MTEIRIIFVSIVDGLQYVDVRQVLKYECSLQDSLSILYNDVDVLILNALECGPKVKQEATQIDLHFRLYTKYGVDIATTTSAYSSPTSWL